jgi:hypothetical protein
MASWSVCSTKRSSRTSEAISSGRASWRSSRSQVSISANFLATRSGSVMRGRPVVDTAAGAARGRNKRSAPAPRTRSLRSGRARKAARLRRARGEPDRPAPGSKPPDRPRGQARVRDPRPSRDAGRQAFRLADAQRAPPRPRRYPNAPCRARRFRTPRPRCNPAAPRGIVESYPSRGKRTIGCREALLAGRTALRPEPPRVPSVVTWVALSQSTRYQGEPNVALCSSYPTLAPGRGAPRAARERSAPAGSGPLMPVATARSAVEFEHVVDRLRTEHALAPDIEIGDVGAAHALIDLGRHGAELDLELSE